MPKLIATRTVTARKRHRCACCGATAVEPGESYTFDVSVYDGRVYRWVSCKPCQRFVGVVWEWYDRPDEGVSGEEIREWAIENKDQPGAREFLARVNYEEGA